MKLLVFAHIPPPHHGQSYMVKLLLDGLGGDVRARPRRELRDPKSEIECYHVNARFSEDMEDIGTFRIGKAMLVFRYCAEALWCRWRHGVRVFYYVPAPGKRAALYRDWMVMLLCRPFFPEFIHHWHAVGLGDWLRTEGTWFERWFTHRLLGRPALGIALGIPSMRDALWFRSQRVELVANGIPDPCPDFSTSVLPVRKARLAARRKLLEGAVLAEHERAEAGGDPEVFRVLYLAHCIRQKGLFDTLEGVLLANAALRAAGGRIRIELTVAGLFIHPDEEQEFRAKSATAAESIRYVGFVSGEQKQKLLQGSDGFCFPTYYNAESFGLVLVEAMACGLAIVTTRWRAIPEILPADYPGFVAPRAPDSVAAALQRCLQFDSAAELRREFENRFTEARYLQALRGLLATLPG